MEIPTFVDGDEERETISWQRFIYKASSGSDTKLRNPLRNNKASHIRTDSRPFLHCRVHTEYSWRQ
jgi:hypothetical protein